MKRTLQRLLLVVAFTGADTESSRDQSTVWNGPVHSLQENRTVIDVDTDNRNDNCRNKEDQNDITNQDTSSPVRDLSSVQERVKPPSTKTTNLSETKRTHKPTVSSSASASLRRIKKEYKDAVQMGICYDWVKGRLITSVSTKRNSADVQLICIGPLATNLRHWHFSFRGVKNSLYESGIYHGVIVLPKDYPATPPRVQLWTPSGRFKPFTDICLSASAYHPESWTPRWTVLSLVHALRLHMLTNPQEIGGITNTAEETLEYARRSLTWKVSWLTGKGQIIVDHGKLLEQGVLSLDLEHYHTEPLISMTENTTDIPKEFCSDSSEDALIDKTDRVDDGQNKDATTIWTDQRHAVEAMETLEKARKSHKGNQMSRKDDKRKKKQESKILKSTRKDTPSQSTKRLHGLFLTFHSIFATPYRRGLFILFLFWLLARP